MTLEDIRSPQLLRGMTWDHPRGVDGLRAAAPLIRERHGVTVEWETRSLLAFGDQHIADFAADFDLMVIDHPHVPDAAAAGALLPLDEYLSQVVLDTLKRESVGASHDSYGYALHQWALAVDAAAQVSAFRPDLADGVPPYWSDVLELAASGQVLWPYKPVDAFSTFATLLAQNNAPLARPDLFIDRDAAGNVLNFMIELAAHVPDWCANANPIDVAEALSSGSEYALAVAVFGYTNYSRAGFRRHRLAYDDLPSFDGRAGGSTLGGAGIAVSSATEHPKLAAQVAAAFSGSEVQSGPYATGGGQPSNLRAWRSEAQNLLAGGFYRNTLRTHERAWVRPRVLGWPKLQLELSRIVHSCLVARSILPDALDRLESLPKLLEENIA